MTAPIVHTKHPVTLVGGGVIGTGDLELALERAPQLVAANGGVAAVLRAGLAPLAVIGDFDSLAEGDRRLIPQDRLFEVSDQDSTDFDKALRNIVAPVILAVGFLGGRLDHQLAAFNTLVRRADRPCILIGSGEVVFHAPPVLDLPLDPGAIVSLFPMTRVSGTSRGLEWPIDGLDLAPDGFVGISNRALGPVRLETTAPGLLVIAPRSSLDSVLQSIGSG